MTVAIGAQNFADVRERGIFYIDKTDFVRQWWLNKDDVTFVCRPRRFGKTLNLSTVEYFFSTRYRDRSDLFEGLRIWEDAAMRAEQGCWPVISLSFAGAKGTSFEQVRARICARIAQAYRDHADQVDPGDVSPSEAELLGGKRTAVFPDEAPDALLRLCELLFSNTRAAASWGRTGPTPRATRWSTRRCSRVTSRP